MNAAATGANNVGVGKSCLHDLTSGYSNVAVGLNAAFNLENGNQNVAIGTSALVDATSANNNVAIGINAGGNITTGYSNTLVGEAAGLNGTTIIGATCVGTHAGHDLTTGGENLLLGNSAGRSISPSGAITTGTNNVVLGNNNVANLFCADTSISSSDARDKTDVESFNIGLSWIEALRPVTYRWDRRTWYGTEEEPYGTPDGSKKRQRLHLGFIAQEALAVEQANGYGTSNDDSLLLNLTDDGMSYGMKYERLVPILVNAIKELSTRVTALEAA